MRVGRNCSRHGQSVSTGLLLGDSPSLVIFILQGEITVNQFWPLNTSLRLQDSVLAIQTDHSAQFPKCGHQIVHRPNFHNPLDLPSRYEAQLYGGNDSKKAIPTVNQPK